LFGPKIREWSTKSLSKKVYIFGVYFDYVNVYMKWGKKSDGSSLSCKRFHDNNEKTQSQVDFVKNSILFQFRSKFTFRQGSHQLQCGPLRHAGSSFMANVPSAKISLHSLEIRLPIGADDQSSRRDQPRAPQKKPPLVHISNKRRFKKSVFSFQRSVHRLPVTHHR